MAEKRRINVTVRTNSGLSRIDFDKASGSFKALLKASPEKGKANAELLKLFKKTFGTTAAIVSGARSKRKVIELI